MLSHKDLRKLPPEAAGRVLHVGRPNIGDTGAFDARMRQILERRWLSEGAYVEEFEARVAELAGVEHCVATCNATVALEIAVRALGLEGEVIVPSFTFVATAHALQWQGITPVFCDISADTYNLDPNRIEELITPRTTGIVGVHVFGRPCPVDQLEEIASRRGLRLLFDAAHALGCTYRGRMIGGFGDAEVFSFHATKFVNSFEGGAVVTNDDELAAKIRLMKNFGFTAYDATSMVGLNGKMTEVSAAMGLTNLESMERFVAANQRNYEHYRNRLNGIDGIAVAEVGGPGESSNYQYVTIEVEEERAGVDRDAVMEFLQREYVLARRYFYPGCHQMEPYRSQAPELHLPETERLAGRILALPTGTAVTDEDVDRVCDLIAAAVEGGRGAERVLQRVADSAAE